MNKSYDSQILSLQSEVQLQKTLKRFKAQNLPLWKYAAFIGYNFLSFSLMALYGFSFKYKFRKPGQKRVLTAKDLTIFNIIKKGTKHGVAISSLYIGGMYLLVNYIFPFQIFYKLSEIQSKIHSFAIRYDPFYQQTMLFAKMRKFDLPETLISQIKSELENKKAKLIQSNGLTQETIDHLIASNKWFIERKDFINGFQDFT